MLNTDWKRRALVLTIMALLAVCTARAEPQQGVGQKVGEKLDEAGVAVKRGLGRAGDRIKEDYGKAKASVNALGLEGRVYGHLRWDKALDGATIDVSASKDGTVTLTGSVADAVAKARPSGSPSRRWGYPRSLTSSRPSPRPSRPENV